MANFAASVPDFVRQLVPGLAEQIAQLPVPDTYMLTPGQVEPFGLRGGVGQRAFRKSLTVHGDSSRPVAVQAMYPGVLRWVGAGVAVGIDPRRQARYYRPTRPGWLLQVDPRVPFSQILQEDPDNPLQPLLPKWIVYEGVTPPDDLLRLDRLEALLGFEFNKADVLPDHQDALLQIAEHLDAFPDTVVKLKGYTDNVGTERSNLELGQRRAAALKAALETDYGVPPGRIIALQSEGEGDPWEPEQSSESARSANRRVEISISSTTTTVLAGRHLGLADDGLTLTVIHDRTDYVYLDPFDLFLRIRPDLANASLLDGRDALTPPVASGRVHCVSSLSGDGPLTPNDAAVQFHPVLGDAITAAADADIIWICDTGEYGAALNTSKAISLIGGPPNARPTLVPQPGGQPLFSAHDISTVGLRIFGLHFARGDPAGPQSRAVEIDDASNVHIRQCTFTGLGSPDATGTLLADGGGLALLECRHLLVEGCVFQECYGHYGGAILAEFCENVVVTGPPASGLDTLLADERTPLEGGSLDTLNGNGFESRFISNMAFRAGAGIAVHASTFRIRNSYFFDNNSEQGADCYGGAIAIRVPFDALPSDSVIERCVIHDNRSTWGGGIAAVREADDSNGLKITNFSFMDNLSKITENFVDLHILENVIFENRAGEIGGGLHLLANDFHVERNLIADNSADRNGGGICCGARSVTTLSANRILRNRVTRTVVTEPTLMSPGGGAGIYATFWTSEGTRTELTLKDNRVIANTSTEDGGGLRATCGAIIRLDSGNHFEANVARQNGGAISLVNGSLFVVGGNDFVGNKALGEGVAPSVTDTIAGIEITYSWPIGNGGAIQCAASLSSLVGPALYNSCSWDGSTLRLEGAAASPITFRNNAAARAGAAINVFQEPGATTSIPFLTNRVGVLNQLVLSYVNLDSNVGEPSSSPTSSIACWDVNWSIDAAPDGSAFDFSNVNVALEQGVGIRLIRSDQVTRQPSVVVSCPAGSANCVPVVIES